MNPPKKILVSKDRIIYWSSGDLHTSFGILKEKDLKKNKNKIVSHLGVEFTMFKPDFFDLIKKIKRIPQAITEKDIGLIVSITGITKNSLVLDAGVGSGKLTAYLATHSKKVIGYEINKDYIKTVKENLKMLGIKNVKIKNEDIYNGISERNLDLITLDLPEPWRVVKAAFNSLRPGGFLVSYSPQITQIKDFLEGVRKHNFKIIKITNLLDQEWIIEDKRTKPKEIKHTAFLAFVRKV